MPSVPAPLQAGVKFLEAEVEVFEEEADCEERPSEEGCGLGQPRVLRVLLVHLLVGDQVPEVLLEAVPDQGEVPGDVVDDGAEAGEAGGDDRLVVEQDQLHAGFLQLTQEDLTGVLDQRNCQLQGPEEDKWKMAETIQESK